MLVQPTIEEVIQAGRRRQDEQERRKLLYERQVMPNESIQPTNSAVTGEHRAATSARLIEVWSLKLAGKG